MQKLKKCDPLHCTEFGEVAALYEHRIPVDLLVCDCDNRCVHNVCTQSQNIVKDRTY